MKNAHMKISGAHLKLTLRPQYFAEIKLNEAGERQWPCRWYHIIVCWLILFNRGEQATILKLTMMPTARWWRNVSESMMLLEGVPKSSSAATPSRLGVNVDIHGEWWRRRWRFEVSPRRLGVNESNWEAGSFIVPNGVRDILGVPWISQPTFLPRSVKCASSIRNNKQTLIHQCLLLLII